MAKIQKLKEISISKLEVTALSKRLESLDIKPTVDIEKFALAVKSISPDSLIPFNKQSNEIQESVTNLNRKSQSFHGAKIALSWFPFPMISSPCSDKFGYLTSNTVRQSSKLDFNVVNISLMNQLGDLMGGIGKDAGGNLNSPAVGDSNIPSGYTYFGQFVDHDITLDVSSNIEISNDATTINNMRSPSLDLDNLYGRGPALDPFLYEFPNSGASNNTAIKFKLGTNTNNGKGGPSTSNGGINGMSIKNDFDVPRISGTNTAVIGDPRNDENLFVAQFQMAMLKFHNAVVDLHFGSPNDIFVESKKVVTHHYQWAVVNDYLKRICGSVAVSNALTSVTAAVGSSFSMPVEFSVAAYRFGHSLIRDSYWINHNFINEPLMQAFNFIRNPNLPVRSNWVVDFNAFFQTGISVPVNNLARKIDSNLANGLNSIPGVPAALAKRNLKRGLAMGLPSGQATATALNVTPLTSAQLLSGLDPAEVNLLNSNNGILLTNTPLWYYILREASVLNNGNTLGPLGAKIVAETFIRILKRDTNSYLNKVGGFTPFLPRAVANDFTLADLINFSGVNRP